MDRTPRDASSWWRARARRLAWRVNAGWWLDRMLPSLLGVSVAAAAGILLIRRQGLPAERVWWAFAGAVVIAAGTALLRARRDFESERDGLVRLEARHRLQNRLTAAADGIGDWPPVPETASDGLAWAWRRSLWHPVVAVCLLVAAGWVPVHPVREAAALPLEEPIAWGELEHWMDTLEEDAPVDERGLDAVRDRIDQLRARPMEEWYSHSSLEAGDSLRQQTGQAIRELQRDLEAALNAMATLESRSGPVSDPMQAAWKEFMSDALDGLEGGPLPIDPELLEQLREIDPSSLRPLTPEERAALMEALKNGLQACRACDGSGTNLVAAAITVPGWGSGGIDRGPGAAPLALSDRPTRVEPGRSESLENRDLSRAALGDTLAEREIDHEVDASLYQGPQAPGTVDALGEGGETVRHTPLDPDEEEVLKRYFR